jgi:hypothetical protein
MQNSYLTLSKSSPEAREELWGQAYLGHKKQGAASLSQDLRGHLKIDFRLPGACHSV